MLETLNQNLFYNTILCQTFSADKQFLLSGSIYGDISIHEISKILEPQQGEESDIQGPTYRFTAYPDQQVQSMIETENFFITGTSGEISGWDWKIITSSKAPKAKVSWTINLPSKRDTNEKPDVNSMVYSLSNHMLHIGCGDNKIYTIDLEVGKVLRSLEGHEDFIHSISLIDNQLASASEDGSVRLWDLRKKENTNILQPHLAEKVARPKLGKWIGCVDFTEDWLLCGGGPKLSLWHMRTMEPATIFDLPDSGIHVSQIYEERIIAGGEMSHVHHLTYQGETLAKIPVSSNTVYSIVHQEAPQKILSITGSSNYLDICSNFNYKELTLKFV